MALPLVLAIGDVGCEVAALLSLHDLCRMHVSSQGLKRETKVLVARSEAAQRKAICDRTPFPTKKALTWDFLAKERAHVAQRLHPPRAPQAPAL